MGHTLRAIIGRPAVTAALAAQFEVARRVRLRKGLEMVPLFDDLFDRMDFSPDARNPEAAVSGWSNLGTRVEARLAELSRISPVAYVYTEYFGGVGEQAGVAFVGGWLATRRDGAGRAVPWSESAGPINDALAAIGVPRDPGKDEFDTLGLGEYRSMDDWATSE